MSFTHNDYEITQRDLIYQGVFRYSRYHLRFKFFNGNWSPVITREMLETGPVAAILPYDPVLDSVVLIEQFRPGALANPESPWLLEIVAGRFDISHEASKDVAAREATEEAGCEILDIFKICEYFVTPGVCNEHLTLYCGRIDASDVNGVHGLKEESEDTRTLTMSTDEALMLLQEGKIKTSPAIISLQWLQLNREWLRQLWQTK